MADSANGIPVAFVPHGGGPWPVRRDGPSARRSSRVRVRQAGTPVQWPAMLGQYREFGCEVTYEGFVQEVHIELPVVGVDADGGR